MKHLIASASVAAIAALSFGGAYAADSAVESDEFTKKAYPDDRGSKNYSTVDPNGANGNGADQIPTTADAQGGRDEAVYSDEQTSAEAIDAAVPTVTYEPNTKADSAVESEEFTELAYPDKRGSKNFAAVDPNGANDNGSDEIPTASNAQGGRDEAVFDTSTVTQ